MRRIRNCYAITRGAGPGLAAVTFIAIAIGAGGGARAAEIVPAIGLTRPVHADGAAKVYGSLALRGNVLPALQSEISVAYRDERRFDDQLRLRMWPITASLWLTPIPAIYAGAGVGWYQTSYDWQSSVASGQDETRQQFGVHVGGGLRVPLAPSASLDLGGRYVMMREQEAPLVPERFDPDFWTTSVGLGFHF